MPTKLEVAPAEISSTLLTKVLKSRPRFDPIREHELRIEILIATRDDGRPAVKRHGVPALAVVKIVGPEERAKGGPDVRIKIDWRRWLDHGPRSREAGLCHELYHVAFRERKGGGLKRDVYGRPAVYLIPDDWSITGFKEVADWYGEDSIERRSFNALKEILSQFTFEFADDPPTPDLADGGDVGGSTPESDVIRDTYAALLSVGYTESRARAAIDRAIADGSAARCKDVSSLIDAIHRGQNEAEAGSDSPPVSTVAFKGKDFEKIAGAVDRSRPGAKAKAAGAV